MVFAQPIKRRFMKRLILVLIFISVPLITFAETLQLPKDDIKDIQLSECQANNTKLNAIVNNILPDLMKRAGCELDKQKQIVCPDKKEEK